MTSLNSSTAATAEKKKRVQVHAACVQCKKAHAACSHTRPCDRCVRTNQADACADGPQLRAKRSKDKPGRHDGNFLSIKGKVNAFNLVNQSPSPPTVELSLPQPDSVYLPTFDLRTSDELPPHALPDATDVSSKREVFGR